MISVILLSLLLYISMSSLRGGKDPVISSSPVGSDDNTSWPVDADVIGQVNSSLEESSTNHWRVKSGCFRGLIKRLVAGLEI